MGKRVTKNSKRSKDNKRKDRAGLTDGPNLAKEKKKTIPKGRNWAFTDYEQLDWGKIFKEGEGAIRYIIAGKEICPKTKKEHIQGFIQFNDLRRMTAIKKIVKSKTIHLESCKGTAKENHTYCSKDGNFREWGTMKSQGQRTDIEDIKWMLDNGKPMIEIADNYFGQFIRYHSGFMKYKQLVDKKNRSQFRHVEVTVITGSTGSGKTRQAMESTDGDVFKITADGLTWWDGYEGEDTILIDEYSNQVGITMLLNILDGYILRLPIKGAFTYANWTKVFITTNLLELHPQAKPEHKAALNRRITKTIDLWGDQRPITNYTEELGKIQHGFAFDD